MGGIGAKIGTMTKFTLNGRPVQYHLPSETPLLWALRDASNLTGTKFGCGVGLCGACTVHIDGVARRSCQALLSEVEGAKVTTIEGLSEDRSHPLQRAWISANVPQCGYCQSGMIMAAAAFLDKNPKPTAQDVRRSITNLCRCGTYPRILRAILSAAHDDVEEVSAAPPGTSVAAARFNSPSLKPPSPKPLPATEGDKQD